MHDVPYANAARMVKYGTLVSSLRLAGNTTQTPDTHVAYFIGEHPCHADGSLLTQIQHAGQHVLGEGLVANWSFSSKPRSGYPDYHSKMTTYINIISGPARQLDPQADARTYRIIAADNDSVFRYLDTSTARGHIGHIAARAAVERVAIVGLGGTGAYVLDLLSKTETKEIHLYDADHYWQHNAFRAPGATAAVLLEGAPLKVDYYAQHYGVMRTGIIPHPQHADADTLDALRGMDCVFICIDDGPSREVLLKGLHDCDATVIDVGMGLVVQNDQIAGQVRVTTTMPGRRDHVERRIPTHQTTDNDVYGQNIQIAELNALNAALAVIKWKKIRQVYADPEHELNSIYVVDGNLIVNDEGRA